MDSIPLGSDFAEELDKAVAQCQVLLVIIGKTWVTVTEADGTRRLDNPDDFVRIEVESALKRNIPVIPILLEGANMPKRSQLPKSLHTLARRNGTQVGYDPRFHADMDRLVKGIKASLILQKSPLKSPVETELIKQIRDRCKAEGFTRSPQVPFARVIRSWINEVGTGSSLQERVDQHVVYWTTCRDNPSLSHDQVKAMLSDSSKFVNKGKPKDAVEKSNKIIDVGNGVTLELVRIPGGEFLMGSPEGEECDTERPQHKVTVLEFWMGKYPITQAQYKAVIGNNPSRFKGDEHPVESLSWSDALRFCEKLSKKTGGPFRLPSEAEWEYACRAETSTRYFLGDNLTKEQANFDKTKEQTIPVGTYPPNFYGLYDMHGNVFEWCQDHWHPNYNRAPVDGSAWTKDGDSSLRVLRGGSWADPPCDCRSAFRNNSYPLNVISTFGFRVVSAPPDSLP